MENSFHILFINIHKFVKVVYEIKILLMKTMMNGR